MSGKIPVEKLKPNSGYQQENHFSSDEIERLMDPILFKQESGRDLPFNYYDPDNVDKNLRAGM